VTILKWRFQNQQQLKEENFVLFFVVGGKKKGGALTAHHPMSSCSEATLTDRSSSRREPMGKNEVVSLWRMQSASTPEAADFFALSLKREKFQIFKMITNCQRF
jgi:hypothetical protein